MFTGLISDVGKLVALSGHAVKRLTIRMGYDTTSILLGASIACNGACLTVVALGDNTFEVELSPETLALTTFAQAKMGDKINLERALRMGDELGGHFVTGHVDAVARILKWQEAADGCWDLQIELPAALTPYIAAKGSIVVDGISLTVNRVSDTAFDLMIIPHTIQHTNLAQRQTGDFVNLEIDLLARYVVRAQQILKNFSYNISPHPE